MARVPIGRIKFADRPAAPWAGRYAGDDYGHPAEPDWRDIDWSRHVRTAEIDGRPMNYVDYAPAASPDARPVVLIHGLTACWQSWLEQIPRLGAEGRRVIAVDLPGFGASPMPVDEISISGYGRAVEALCDQLDLGQVVVVGHSMGGFTAAEIAIQFPKRVERLVLEAAAGISTNDVQREPMLAGARMLGGLLARTAAQSRELSRRPRSRWLALNIAVRYPSRIPSDFAFELLSHADTEGFMPALTAIIDYDFRERLSQIQCPTLVVWGDHDMLVPLADADEYVRVIPGARKVVFEDTGHSPMMERPQKFNDMLVDFLTEERDERPSEGEIEASKASASS
jgi:pimeloyl-ACP methyl ester carboxylesterase